MKKIKIHKDLEKTEVEQAAVLLVKFVGEDKFWELFQDHIKQLDLSHHDILEDDTDIFNHLRFMFQCDLNIEIHPYKTKYPFSTVIGYAKGNRVYENTRKLNALSLPKRVGHLGHEIVHLFGYRHEYQGQNTSAAVIFGYTMEMYAEMRIAGMNSIKGE